MGVVLSVLDFRQVVEAKLVIFGSCIAIPCLKQAYHVLGGVLPPVSAVGIAGRGSGAFKVSIKTIIGINRYFQISGENVEEQAMVC